MTHPDLQPADQQPADRLPADQQPADRLPADRLLAEQARAGVAQVRAALAREGRDDAVGVAAAVDRLPGLRLQLVTALRTAEVRPAADTRALGEALVELSDLTGDLRELAVARRFAAVARIQDALARLRRISDVRELLDAAAEELGGCCDFDRTVISRRRGSTWQAAAMWFSPEVDPSIAAATRTYLTRQWIPLRPGTLEGDLVHRRTAAVIRAEDARVDRDLVAATSSTGYVASPVMPSGEVIGFLQVDCHLGRRVLTDVDRDNLWTFAEGFGLLFEHAARAERLRARRTRVHAAFEDVERELAALSSAELQLARRDLESLGLLEDSAGPGDGALLSSRERAILDLMATGAGNREIAERLFIAEATVKSHATRIYRKLGASGRADAVARYLRLTRGQQ